MSTTNGAFGRRAFIRTMGLASGAAFLTPILDGLLRDAHGQVPTTKRFLLYTSAHGIASRHLATTAASQSDFTMPAALAGLKPFQSETVVFRNLFNTTHQFLHSNSYSATSGYKVASPSANYGFGEPGGPSIDFLLAQELGKGTREPLMVLNGSSMSASGRQRPIPGIGDPASAFTKYFQGAGGAGTSDQDRARALKMERSFLDFMLDDIRRSQAQLVAPEREKLDTFLTSVREMEQKLAAAATAATPASCKSVPAPGGTAAYEARLRGHGLVAAHAFACGVTRHATIGVSGANYVIFRELGVSQHQHSIHHEGNTAAITKILAFHSTVIGNIFATLKKFPEGNGTMADNTLIAWVSEGGSHHHGFYDVSAITVGTAGHALRAGGSYITYGQKERSICELWLTVARAMGSSMTSFGDGTNPGRTTLPGIV
jgi:hypothetical protein